ncbi:MAG: redoxin domain-containing protein [Prevotellaceae bacterium]|jgi:thiol-disulfide isomerase/thioredoxin|nr:redoxin domain-containing protein [Prevotellaceae bacterium]
MFAASTRAAYRIEVTIAGAEKEKVYIARYSGMALTNIDSSTFSAKGKAVFANAKATLPGGLYAIRFSVDEGDGEDRQQSQQAIEFIVSGEAKFSLAVSANMLNVEKSLKYSRSAENEGFKKYIDGQRRVGRKIQDLQMRYRNFQNDPDSVLYFQGQYETVINLQKQQVSDLQADYKGTLLATLITCMQEPEMPEMPLPQGTANVDSVRQRQFLEFAKVHFFDNFNFADERIVNTPMLENRLIVFFQQVMLREPANDINVCINRLLDRVMGQSREVYRYVLTWLYDRYTDSPIEGHHVVGIHLCDIMSDSTKVSWLTDKDKTKLKQNIRKYKLNPIGAVATDLMLQTADGEHRSLHALRAPLTLLYFFNPGCGTCRMTTPVLHELYDKYREQGLEVFAVYPDKDTAEWKSYVEENGYTDWINVWDAEGTADIYEKYSLHAIPQLYVLDEDKRVRYKDVHMNDLEGILYVTFSQIPAAAQQNEQQNEHIHNHY